MHPPARSRVVEANIDQPAAAVDSFSPIGGAGRRPAIVSRASVTLATATRPEGASAALVEVRQDLPLPEELKTARAAPPPNRGGIRRVACTALRRGPVLGGLTVRRCRRTSRHRVASAAARGVGASPSSSSLAARRHHGHTWPDSERPRDHPARVDDVLAFVHTSAVASPIASRSPHLGWETERSCDGHGTPSSPRRCGSTKTVRSTIR